MTNQNAFKLLKCGIEGPYCKLRTKDFSIDAVRERKEIQKKWNNH